MCEACGGERLEYLGRLGRRDHFRCRECGMTQSTEGETHRINRPTKREA